MMKVDDEVSATVEVTYSNIGLEWNASLIDEDGKTLAYGTASTRAGALRELADEIE